MSGNSAPAPDYTAQNKFAQINRQVYDTYKQVYQPVEDAMLAQSTPAAIRSDVNQAGTISDQAAKVGYGVQRRNFARYGVSPDGATMADLGRQKQVSDALTKVDNMNRTRTQATDLAGNIKQQALQIGKGDMSSAQNGFGVAAGNEANRNNANRQIAAENQAGWGSFIGTGIGVAASFI